VPAGALFGHIVPQDTVPIAVLVGHPQYWTGGGDAVICELPVALVTALLIPLVS
jgi:hypothetical protein